MAIPARRDARRCVLRLKHGARLMLEQGRPGVVINTWSVNARHPMEANSAYCAAKAGVDMITRCGAPELGPQGLSGSSASRQVWWKHR